MPVLFHWLYLASHYTSLCMLSSFLVGLLNKAAVWMALDASTTQVSSALGHRNNLLIFQIYFVPVLLYCIY